MKNRYKVVIVGGGPVGVALAVVLGLRGISCALVERRLEPQRIPKGQNLTQRSMEHFYFWGIADELRAARILPPEHSMGILVAYSNLSGAHFLDRVLGVLSLRRAEDEQPPVPVDEILRLIEDRHAARRRRDFTAADRIRDDLAGRGVLLEDSSGTTRWKRK